MNGLPEKIIANWLDSCSERSYQIPFCFLLISSGHRLIHSTRHQPLELGKDIISVDPEGVICAYQLKGNPGGKLTISQWQDINGQLQDLVAGDVAHPSIKKVKKFRPFLVTNGQIEEEVWRAINDVNRTYKKRFGRKLETLCRGDLLEMARQTSLTLWPSELEDTFTFLQLFIQNGKDPLDKEKFATFLEKTFCLDRDEKKPNANLARRRITSAALISALALTSSSKNDNHSSIYAGWMIYISCLLAFVTRWELPKKIYESSLSLAKDSALNALADLVKEFDQNKRFNEGDLITDKLYRIEAVRATYITAYVGVLGLYQKINPSNIFINADSLRKILELAIPRTVIWGESTVPYYLTIYWFWRTVDATKKPDEFLIRLFNAVSDNNSAESETPYLPPYYDADLAYSAMLLHSDDIGEYSFSGKSYTLESLLLLLVRKNWKQTVKRSWSNITKMVFQSFEPQHPWQYFLWRTKQGTNIDIVPKIPRSWDQLKTESQPSSENIPKVFIEDPLLYLLFLLNYPHRLFTDAVLWLDKILDQYI